MGPVIHVSTPWPALLTSGTSERPLREAIVAYLCAQRWFPARTRRLARVTLEHRLPLDPRTVLLIVAADYQHGDRDRFAMPLALATGDAAARVARETPARIVAEVRGAAAGLLHDDMAEGLGAALLDFVAARATLPTTHGTLLGEPAEAFATLRGEAAVLTARRITAEQSNTSVILGERLILKLIRRLEPGLNPDYEIGRHLTGVVRFPGVPALAGALLWREPDTEPVVMAIVQAFVPGAVGLRERLVGEISTSLHHLARQDAAPPFGDSLRATAAAAAGQAHALGRRTAALHLALADARGDAAFTPEAAGPGELRAIAAAMRAQAAGALDVLASQAAVLPRSARMLTTPILEGRETLLAVVDRLAGVTAGLARIRVHGDYQLDQVLQAGDAFVVIDFEGEPLRPLNERRSKTLALKDVAGMLRSYSYAAYAGLFEAAGDDEALAGRLDRAARWWEASLGTAFVDGYRAAAGAAPFVPAGDADFHTVLDAFLVEKAAYELRYELGHRPAWLRIPLRGMIGILERTAGG